MKTMNEQEDSINCSVVKRVMNHETASRILRKM